jgi:hypothetical protein
MERTRVFYLSKFFTAVSGLHLELLSTASFDRLVVRDLVAA